MTIRNWPRLRRCLRHLRRDGRPSKVSRRVSVIEVPREIPAQLFSFPRHALSRLYCPLVTALAEVRDMICAYFLVLSSRRSRRDPQGEEEATPESS